MTSQEKAINLRYIFLTFKPKRRKKNHQYMRIFILHVLVFSIYSEECFWPQYMYHKMNPKNGFRWCPLGKLSHLGLEQLHNVILLTTNHIIWSMTNHSNINNIRTNLHTNTPKYYEYPIRSTLLITHCVNHFFSFLNNLH